MKTALQGNLVKVITEYVKLGELRVSNGTLPLAALELKAAAANRLVLNYEIRTAFDFVGTYGSGAPSFPADSGILDRIVDRVQIKGDKMQQQLVDCSPELLKRVHQMAYGIAPKAGSSSAAAAVAHDRDITYSNTNKLVAPTTTQVCSARETFRIPRTYPNAEEQIGIRTIDDFRGNDQIIVGFSPKPLADFLAQGSDAMTVSAVNLTIEVWAECLVGVNDKEKIATDKLLIRQDQKNSASAGDTLTFDLMRIGYPVFTGYLVQDGAAGKAFSNEAISTVKLHKNIDKDVIVPTKPFLNVQSSLVADCKLVNGIAPVGFGGFMYSPTESKNAPNAKLSDNETLTSNNQLELKLSSYATVTNSVTAKLVEMYLVPA